MLLLLQDRNGSALKYSGTQRSPIDYFEIFIVVGFSLCILLEHWVFIFSSAVLSCGCCAFQNPLNVGQLTMTVCHTETSAIERGNFVRGK
jgi:hypothetical protein